MEVGRRGKVRRVFFGRTEGRTADKKRSKNFVLGSPHLSFQLSLKLFLGVFKVTFALHFNFQTGWHCLDCYPKKTLSDTMSHLKDVGSTFCLKQYIFFSRLAYHPIYLFQVDVYLTFYCCCGGVSRYVKQTSVNWGPDSTFDDEANITRWSPKPSSCQVIKLMDRA